MAIHSFDSPYKGSGQITREQFLFYETRTIARLLSQGMDDSTAIEQVISQNLFQYPTERSTRLIATGCIKRLKALDDPSLIQAIATQPSDVAKQICLYAMMKQYRLIWDFMIVVIGNKYRQQDYSFGRRDVNSFFLQLQEQDDTVASWSESTIKKISSVLVRILVENEYLDNAKSTTLNPVLIGSLLENAIRESGQEIALPAFNCFF